MKVKLTGPQRSLLADLADNARHVYDGYPPIQKLLELGCVEARETRYSMIYEITDAGRAALTTKEPR